ncbi:hypothetical protein TRVL_01223 [Trypanosoma vivax]|uniref:Tetratricopeptide repeat protein 29 n=1 Tax=Trypanosoma vivax (strain Y486) TaxID=1055687 RepID=G0TSL5_TRYVY|nr:hypothetical protein TRVL_01223 [Trypanosoma vivax]CCC46942.1 conserved hypothetical protein [Trypanosoma vivax Y486]
MAMSQKRKMASFPCKEIALGDGGNSCSASAQKQKANQLILAPVKPPVRADGGPLVIRQKPRRESLITQQQRDALVVSSFGIGTTRHGQPDQSAASVKSGLATAAGSALDVVIAQTEKNSLRFHLCVDTLSEGCVNSFIRLFHLSHRKPVCVDQLAQTLFTIPDDKLTWVKEQLAAVEVLRRQSEFQEVCDRCQLLADYFESERDYEEAAWHYETAQRFASESLDHSLEQKVRVAFGAFFERRRQFAKAVAIYDRMYRVAVAVKDDERANQASHHLIRTLMLLSRELKSDNPEEAMQHLVRALEVARRVCSVRDEAAILHALGNICEQMGNLLKAMEYQKAFFEAAKRAGLPKSEQRASLCVASLQERLCMNTEAMDSLQRALELSKENNDLEGVCRATMQLGEAFKNSGDQQQALGNFRANFEAASKLKNRDMVDQARVALGFALGEHYLKEAGGGRGYVSIVCEDVEAQLEWLSKGIL